MSWFTLMYGGSTNLVARFTMHGRTDSDRAVVTLDVGECNDAVPASALTGRAATLRPSPQAERPAAGGCGSDRASFTLTISSQLIDCLADHVPLVLCLDGRGLKEHDLGAAVLSGRPCPLGHAAGLLGEVDLQCEAVPGQPGGSRDARSQRCPRAISIACGGSHRPPTIPGSDTGTVCQPGTVAPGSGRRPDDTPEGIGDGWSDRGTR